MNTSCKKKLAVALFLSVALRPAKASEADALAISANIRAHHMPYGTMLDPIFAAPGSQQIISYTRCGDSAIWTGHYLAAEAFRYKVTGSPDALANVKAAIAGIKSLADVTGTNLLARCLVPMNSPYAQNITKEEQNNGIYRNDSAGYYWIGNTSRDQYAGVFFGLGVAFDMVSDASVRSSISDLATRLLDYLRSNNWIVRMPDGAFSTTFIGRADQQLSFLWDPSLHNPYVMNWNASIQYEINPNYLLSAVYQGSGGVGLIEQWQLNTFPVNFGANDPALRAAAFAAPQNYRPYPQFGDILARSNFGHSTYHSGTVQLQKRYSRGLVLNTFYTFSKAIDAQDSDNGGSVGVAPLQNRGLEKGRAGYDRNHRFIGMATYELPVGRGKHFMNRGGTWNYLFGGYQIAWIQTVESGNPMSFSFANSPYNYYPTFVSQRRPDVVVAHPGIRSNWGDMGGDRFNQANINPIIDINDFAYPAAFTPGNSGRNIVTGTRLLWSQVSAQKNFKFRERWNVQLRWDFQNPFHNYNFNPPTNTVDFQNPKTFGKLSADQRTASVGGEALMNLTLQVTW